jgi:hypothetical protein
MRQSYTLEQIIAIADSRYPDHLVLQASQKKGLKSVGDFLATFIANEIKETFDPDAPADEQLSEAIQVMRVARGQLQDVCDAFKDEAKNIQTTRRYRVNFYDKNSTETRSLTVEAENEVLAEDRAQEQAKAADWPSSFVLSDSEELS